MFSVCLGRGEGCCGSDPGPVPAERTLPQSYPHASKVRLAGQQGVAAQKGCRAEQGVEGADQSGRQYLVSGFAMII